MSAAVVSTSVIGSAATTIHRGRGSARARRRTCVAERAGVGEEQRRVEPEDHESRQLLGLGVELRGRGSRPCRRLARASSRYGHHARRNTLRIDSATAIAMPCSTPSSATPRKAAIDSTNSARR